MNTINPDDMNKTTLAVVAACGMTFPAAAQENLTYQKPPQEILELADFKRAPLLSINGDNSLMVFAYSNTYKTLEELSKEEMRLGGLRIDPNTNIGSTVRYSNNLTYKGLKSNKELQLKGLPENPNIAYLMWSPDQTKIAFTNTSKNGVELWIGDFKTGEAKQITGANLNANLGRPFVWMADSQNLLVLTLPQNRPSLINTKSTLPTGPVVSNSTMGVKSQNMTHQDLIQNPTDEANFETLITSEIYKVGIDGTTTFWKGAAMYNNITMSPDAQYVLINSIERPFSYSVRYTSFPTSTDVYDLSGKLVQAVHKKPLVESLPQGFMSTYTGKRYISWRADKPATLTWAEALDQGDPAVKVDYRDAVYQQDVPFNGEPSLITKTINRFGGITWGDETRAILIDQWWDTRNMKTYLIDPSKSNQEAKIIFDRNMQDVYNDPGHFDVVKNKSGRNVLRLEGNNAFLIGDGYTAKGQFPFINQIDLNTFKTKTMYRSKYTDKKLDIIDILNVKKGELIVRLQSPTEYPNYYLINTKNKKDIYPLTELENPFKAIQGVYKEVITYKREDGVELSGTLYLPADYDRTKKEKLPMVMWAYPTEYKDKSSAGQLSTNPNEFIYPFYGSPIYWVTQGYAILDDAAFPIVGEGDKEPNDTFVEQLVANAKAAIDAVDALGYIDRNRVAVGGHSYGAFMTANLLTHSDLFAAGIARSGAYNRTLTPFGFQAEQRNYWDVPEVYNTMSPFMHADKMKTPLLLIHGADDNNTGTHTMQSERYFNALKGFGAPTRLVLLPKESHGYAAKESVLHVLWEQDQWLNHYVKNKK